MYYFTFFATYESGKKVTVFTRACSPEEGVMLHGEMVKRHSSTSFSQPRMIHRRAGKFAFCDASHFCRIVWNEDGKRFAAQVGREWSVGRDGERNRVIDLGSMRNSHPLLGSKDKLPYAGWDLAKQVCDPQEVIPIFNRYLERQGKSPHRLSGTAWVEVEASALIPENRFGNYSDIFPELPDFFLLLARKTRKIIRVGNHSDGDSAGFFHSMTQVSYSPKGEILYVRFDMSDLNDSIPHQESIQCRFS